MTSGGVQAEPGDWLSKERAAEHLGTSPKTVQRLISAGVLPHYRVGRSLRLRRAELDAYLETTGRGGTARPSDLRSPDPQAPRGVMSDDLADLGRQAQRAGIRQIFKNRVEDPAYRVAIDRAFDAVGAGDCVRMMGNSLRSWLGGQSELALCLSMWAALRRGVQFQLLLLDPHSTAARERAEVELTKSFTEDPDSYYTSHLYSDIMTVARKLDKPGAPWIPDPALRSRLADRQQVSVRFSKTAPTKHLVCTPQLCFEESYHIGGDREIEHGLHARGIPDQYCFGGFVPVFAYSTAELTGRLLASHFDHSWEAAKGRTLDDVLSQAGSITPSGGNLVEEFRDQPRAASLG